MYLPQAVSKKPRWPTKEIDSLRQKADNVSAAFKVARRKILTATIVEPIDNIVTAKLTVIKEVRVKFFDFATLVEHT